MVNLKWDIHNWITIGLMVLLIYAFAGTVIAFFQGATGTMDAQS